MRPADLALLRIPADPAVAPDGSQIAFSLTRLDLDTDAYRSEIWTVPADGSATPRQLTRGPRDTEPQFSPDGRWLAFLRGDDEGKKPQLHVMAVDGGEARQASEHPLGVTAIAWSPDSTRIAYISRVPEPGRYGTDPDVPAGKEPARRITTLKYRIDGVGYTVDRRGQVFVVDALDETAEPVQLTDGDYEHLTPTWHPDGEHVAFVSARHPGRDRDLLADVFVAPAAGGEARQVTDTRLPVADPAFTLDGATVVFCSQGDGDIFGRPSSLYAIRVGGGEPWRLTDPASYDLRSHQIGNPPLVVTEDAVVTVNLHRGAVHLLRFPTDGGEPVVLIGGERWVTGYDVAGGVVAATVATGVSAGEVVALRDGAENVLTSCGAALPSGSARCRR